MILSFQRLGLGKILFVVLAIGFLVTALWGISQSKILLSKEQMREITGGSPNLNITLTSLGTNWLPTYNSTVNITVNITGDRSYLPDCVAKFYLIPTAYEGYCMNAGNQTTDEPDLEFLPDDQQDDHSGKITWDGKNQMIEARFADSTVTTFVVKVKCHDYGAYSPLYARLYYGNSMLSETSITVPRDDNGNEIADGWMNDGQINYTASDDNETGPSGNNHNGDGFSVYEEYRGFRVKGNHIRTDPSEKDLFVYSNCEEGYGYASNLPSPFKVRLINWGDMENRVMNPKRSGGISGSNQLALKVLKNDIATCKEIEKAYGMLCFGYTPNSPGTPNQVGDITIYYKAIRYNTDPNNDENTTDSDDPKARKRIIGHEIGHGVNLEETFGNPAYDIMTCNYTKIMQMGTTYNSVHTSDYKLR